jgi:hypothetical protein
MSFGFSVGDFVTIFQIVQKIYEQVVDAPEQYKAISDEYATLMYLYLCLSTE